MYLLTPYYLDSRPERQAELDFCLQRNLQNPLIKKVIVFLDSSLNTCQIESLQQSKIETIFCGRRCTYQDCLDYANKYLQGDIVIVANTDIFFDETLQLLEDYELSNKFINLLRWEVIEIDETVIHSQFRVNMGSQDTWIFRSPLKPFVAYFLLGTPGCDNRIAFEAHTVGLQITNPALSIRSHHLHLTNIRNYNAQERVCGPYLLISPSTLEADEIDEEPGYVYVRDVHADDMTLLNSRVKQLISKLPQTLDCQIPYEKNFALESVGKEQRNRPRLTAVVISLNSEKTLAITLLSLAECYDKLVVIDTGSTDYSKEIARKYDADVISADIGNEFQAMMSAVESGWIFLLEQAEFIDEKTRQCLMNFKDICAAKQSCPDSYMVQRRWIAPHNTKSYLASEPHGFDLQLRLFRYSGKLSRIHQSSSFIHGFQDRYIDLDGVNIYSLYLTSNDYRVRQQRSLRSNWFETKGETLRLCLPELQKMQLAPIDSQHFHPTVNNLLHCLESVNPDQNLPLVTPLETKAFPTIVIDSVFFQYFSKSGIARVWTTILKEWVATGFARHLVVIDRAGKAPKISGLAYRNATAYNFEEPLVDREFNERICQEEQASLFISTYYTTPLTCRSAFLAYDMIPESQGWSLSRPVLQAKRQAIGHASTYIAISKNTAKDLTQFFPHIDPSNICTTYCGLDAHFQPACLDEITRFKKTWGITKPYFLIVGSRVQYKNILLFLLAFSELPNRDECSIVCIGGGSLEEEFQLFARQFSIHMLNLSDQELAVAYSGAEALVYPSIYEGFGMPVAEAMACGCPVITCNNSSLEEVAGEAALYVGETDVDGMASALQHVRQPNKREQLAEAGLKRAKRFSWARMAEDIAHVLLKATLPVQPSSENHLIFPNWQHENIAEALTESLSAWMAQSFSSNTALLIAIEDFPSEGELNAEAFMQGILTELFFVNGSLVNNPIHLLPALSPVQWQIILKENCIYIPMSAENRKLVIERGIDQLPTRVLP
jgi:glycosyltransferase involved in cell wall biosynthesis